MPSHAYVLKAPIDEYLAVLTEEDRAERTIKDYRYLLMDAMNALDGQGLETNPKKIGKEEIDFLRNEHYADLNPTNNRRSIGIISAYLEWHGNLVVRKMRIQWPYNLRPNATWLEENQAKAMFEVAEGQERLLLHLELGIGMRRCEVMRLRPQDVAGGVFQIKGKGRLGGKWRKVPFRKDTKIELKPYLELREKMISAALLKEPRQAVPDALMIYAQYGWKLGAYQETAIDKMIKGVAARAGIDPTTCSNHTLRRTCGRMLWHAGVDVVKISTILGHEDIRTTILYLGLDLEDMNSAWSQLEAYLKKQEKIVIIQ
jgi:integrase/recombinase XerD